MLNNKRGQGLSTNAIILIILGVVILVMLIVGFSVGWGTLVPFLKSDNVDTVVQSCATACSTGSVYSYCSKAKELETGEQEVETTCYMLEKLEEFDRFGLDPCNIDCSLNCGDVSVIVDSVERAGKLSQSNCTGTDITALVKDAGGNTGNNCCLV